MKIEGLVNGLLDDDHGINEEAFSELITYLDSIGETALIERINNEAECQDGRFYFPLPNFFGDSDG